MHSVLSPNLPASAPSTGLRTQLARIWTFNPTLSLAILLHAALVPVLIVVALVDPVVINGAPGWIKPLKFALSGGIYGATFLWLLTFVQGRRRWVQLAATVTGLALIVETALISVQVARGTTSHFNISTFFDAAVYNIMGGAIVILAAFNLLLGIWLMFRRLPDPAFAWSLRLAVLITFTGMMTGFLMTMQVTPDQQAQLAAGTPLRLGAHSVGVADGGPGLPLLGWSTEGGDLRVPHFVGLHALQVLPLLAWALARPTARRRLNDGSRTALVVVAGAGYWGLTVLLTWQALRGQSIVSPDALTLTVFGSGLLLAAAAAVAILLRRPGVIV